MCSRGRWRGGVAWLWLTDDMGGEAGGRVLAGHQRLHVHALHHQQRRWPRRLCRGQLRAGADPDCHLQHRQRVHGTHPRDKVHLADTRTLRFACAPESVHRGPAQRQGGRLGNGGCGVWREVCVIALFAAVEGAAGAARPHLDCHSGRSTEAQCGMKRLWAISCTSLWLHRRM